MIPNTQPVINLRNFVKEVYTAALNDSSTLAVLGVFRALLGFQSPAPADHALSARFLYWCQTRNDGNTGQDNGSTVTSAIECLTTIGVCTEDNWPYSTPLSTTPPDAIFSDAQGTKIRQSHTLSPDLATLIQCLSKAQPFVFDLQTFNSTFSDAVAKSGNIPMPGADESQIGTESLLCVGCNQGPTQGFPDVNPGTPTNLVLAKQWPANTFLCVTSRGTGFGLNAPHAGYVTIPFDYVTGSLASGHATIDVEV